MTLILGVDLGTSKVTAVAIDAASGELVDAASATTEGNVTSEGDLSRGRSEWDAVAMVRTAVVCLQQLGRELGQRVDDAVSLGVTGQQHGMVLLDAEKRPVTPFIGWQDQRANDLGPDRNSSWVHTARQRLGDDAVARTGCRLNSGFMATTLFWLNEHKKLPARTSACFLMDFFVAMITGGSLVTDPTVAASAGILNVVQRNWDRDATDALGLHHVQLSDVKEADQPAGCLLPEFSESTGLPAGLPVSVPIGDHQASFLGSISDIHNSVLLNVGTGAQVAVFSMDNEFVPPIELRPFPVRGNLLSNVGLTGGWSFQVVETFVRQLGVNVFGARSDTPVYTELCRLAAQASPDCGGLRCVPTFSGTRSDPGQTGTLSGATPENLTPANFARAVLNGMARNYREAWDQITAMTADNHCAIQLVGAGNGLRENDVLASAVCAEFGIAPKCSLHREEAACGAALVGATSAGVFDSLEEACRIIRYEQAG